MSIRVALLQMDCVEGARQKNLDTVTAAARQATEEGARILALPELWCSGYDLANASKEEWGDAELAFLAQLTCDRDLAVLGGSVLEPGGERYRNTAVAFEGGVERPRYRKLHLFAPLKEDRYLSAGSTPPSVFDIAGLRCATTICYDLRFPEVYRPLALAGAELLFVPAQWPRPRIGHWRALLVARAIESQCYVLGVNRVGAFGATEFAGNSLLVSPSGEVLIDAGEERGVFLADISSEAVHQLRDRFPVLRDRRDDIYPVTGGRDGRGAVEGGGNS